MRSTGFVFLSILFHLGVVFAIAFTPTKIFNEKSGDDTVELSMTEAAENVAEGNAQEKGAVAQEVAQESAPQPEVKKAAPVPVPVAAKPAPPTPAPKAKPAAAVAAKPAAKKSSPKISEAAIAAEVAAESGGAVAQSTSEEAKEEAKEEMKEETADSLVPVKESAPVGVEAANEEAKEEAAAPVAAAAAPIAAATPVAAVAAGSGAGTGDAGRGGDSKEEAVSYLELKQSGGNKPPAYPIKARQENRQGQVELVYQVTKEGKVTDVQVAKSSGSKDLDDEAVRAISQYHFVPGQEGWARHPITFALKGNSAPAPTRGLRTKNAAQAKAE